MRLIGVCAEYLKQGGSPTVVKAYVGGYEYQAALFHALWPKSIHISHLEMLGFEDLVPRAQGLAAKFADADNRHAVERALAVEVGVAAQERKPST